AAGRIAAAALALSCALVIPSGSAQGSSRPRGTPLSFPNPAALARSAFPGGEGPVPHGREAQERTIDLSDVESALDYRTDEPDLPAFLGNEAVALERALAGFLRSSGTALRPDGRLGLMARWARRHLGPGNTLPPQSAFDVLARRLGLAEPIPHLVVVEASGAPRLADVLSARLRGVLDPADYTHVGGFAESDVRRAVVVIALSRRRLTLSPVPRNLPKPGRLRIEGRLIGAFTGSELSHTRPGGGTELSGLSEGPDFGATVDLSETGRHRLEIIAHGPGGPSVVANFPVFVGIDVDQSVGAAAVRGAVLPPGRVRDRILELIDAARADAGLAPVAFDPELAAVALGHSEDMSANGFVSHVSPTTGTMEDRLRRAGVMTHLALENVGRGYDPDEIHRGFMDSPGHRAAVLLEGATHVGLG
ncbi:MAG: CAP domain-containing protein, partial [Candidatus Aminicenantes bacterium]|nr:CAP domain-containing protein [Candidatus Aminicenantes bacterium]